MSSASQGTNEFEKLSPECQQFIDILMQAEQDSFIDTQELVESVVIIIEKIFFGDTSFNLLK